MEYLNKNTKKALDEVISAILDSEEYQKCVELKEKMKNDDDLLILIDEVRSIQKKYIRSYYADSVKKDLDIKIEQLNHIPTYVEYNYYLEKVNQQIDIVRNFLNQYFSKITSEKFDEEERV